jgi:2-polyprenyl-3-methyl-5-hydroxy-6-metoxy-1,4-benzoquinol methylase
MIFMSTNKRREKQSIATDEEWATRHIHEGKEWIENYWKSRNHPHRSFLVKRICNFSPINSVLEIGCASGPNLYQIAKKFPDAKIRGIDINPMAVQEGNKWFEKEGIHNVKLEVGKAQELMEFADQSFDVVLTDAVLIYIPPDEIKQVVKEMLRISRALVLNEWHTFNKWLAFLMNEYYYLMLKSKEYLFPGHRPRILSYSFRPRSTSLGLYVGHWARDYKTLFEEFVPKEKIRITKLPKELWNDKGWQRWGALIEVLR